VREILERLLSGEVSIKEAEKLLQISTMQEIEDVALDIRRGIRTGVPEVVWSEGKTTAKVVEIASAFLEREGRAIVSRVSEEQKEVLRETLSDECELWVNEKARLIVARRRGFQLPWLGRKIGIMTAGTSDVRVAEEARVIAEEIGCEVLTAYDVGIAGFHRHIKPLMRMVEEGVDAIVVVAGMEGALPSVVASLVDVPVIGVPSSVGYGFGAGGIGALTAMLQSCSPGLCVVNIDNGFGAGAYAALIAKRVAKALKESRGGK
jgi:NCAIR mutase (PurE)-related protein